MLLALWLVIQTAPARESAPVLEFPTRGLDDSAAYEGYSARLYRDSRRNAVEIYIDGKTGRVVHLWADALNESIGFTIRRAANEAAANEAAANEAAAPAFGQREAMVGARAGRRWLRYTLLLEGGRGRSRAVIQIGQFLLGSMRIERDFGYAGRVRDSINAPTFVPQEFTALARRLGGAYPSRLVPLLSLTQARSRWRAQVYQPSLDSRNHLWLTISGDARRSRAQLAGRVLTIRPRGAEPVDLLVEIATDGPALNPLTRDTIFTPEFLRFAASVNSPRLEREIRGFELLSSRQKLLASLPTYATYFGRDMFMTALLMEPVFSDRMAEFVIGAALAKLGPEGDVSHEEAVGGQAIREHAGEFLRTGDTTLLRNLQATRENYWMVDDDFQLAVVAGNYFADASVPDARKRQFVARWGTALRKNLAFVARQVAPYAREPVATNLVSFKRDPDGWWHPGSWRDSRVGYAGGRFAFDVNVVWVPAALRAIVAIDSALRAVNEPGIDNVADVARAAEVWRGAASHFTVTLAPAEVRARVGAKLRSLPVAEAAHWDSVLTAWAGEPDTLRFPAVSLDSAGNPIPVMTTDPAMWLLVAGGQLGAGQRDELLRPLLLPYPVGLFIEDVGLAVANDAYASPAVWGMFEGDLYHSPRVVWSREINVLLAALARNGGRESAGDSVRTAVARSGLQYAELWTYKIDAGTPLRAVRYGAASDVQLWSLTDLAVQYLLNSRRPPP
jgi:hypothetical protein